MESTRAIEICNAIIEDCENDAKKLDGLYFSGQTIGPIIGELYATISALANILKFTLENRHNT